jgi:hypothetical protein
MNPTGLTAPTVDLQLDAAPDRSVQGRYVFTNTSGQSLLVLDQLYRTDRIGNLALAPELAYVFFEDRLLTAARQLIRVPPGRAVEWPEVPGIRRLGPRKSLEGTFLLSRPFRCYDPYTRSPEEIPADRIEAAILSVGFLADSPDVHLYRATGSGGETIEYPAYGDVVLRQVLVRSEPAAWPNP